MARKIRETLKQQKRKKKELRPTPSDGAEIVRSLFDGCAVVMLAHAGIQGNSAVAWNWATWIPAFAGMTFRCVGSKTFWTD